MSISNKILVFSCFNLCFNLGVLLATHLVDGYLLLHVLQLSVILFVPASYPFSMHHSCKTYLLLYVRGVSMTNLKIVSCGSVCILNSTLWLQMEFYPVHANKVRVPGSEGPNTAINGLRSL